MYSWEEVSSRSSYVVLVSHLLDVKPDIKPGHNACVKASLREILSLCGVWQRESVEMACTGCRKAEGKCKDGTPGSGSREHPGRPLNVRLTRCPPLGQMLQDKQMSLSQSPGTFQLTASTLAPG